MLRKIFDSTNSVSWLLLGIIAFTAGLGISFFIPVIYAMARFSIDSKVAFSPSELTIWYQIFAFFALALGFYIIYRFKKKSVRFLGALVGLFLFSLISYFAFNSYTYVDQSYIEVGKGFKKLTYTYDEMDALYLYTNGDVDYFEIVTKDGEKLEIVFGGLIDDRAKNHIRRTLEGYGIMMEDRT